MQRTVPMMILFASLLAACNPVGQTRPPSQPVPSASAAPGTPASSSASTSAPDASLKLRLQGDASLAGFRAQQASLALCLGRIQRLQTRLSLPGRLPETSRQVLLAQGAAVSEEDGLSVVELGRELDLAALLAGIEIGLEHLSAGEAEVRTSFRDSEGTELGFVAYRVQLTRARAQAVSLSLKPAAGQPADTTCPRLEAVLSGATFQGAGGQLTSSSPLPMPVSSPTVRPPVAAGAPAAPTGLRVTEQTSTALGLEWAADAGVTAWKVYIDGTPAAELSGDVTAYRFSGLRAGSTHTLGVQAIGAGGESGIATLSTSTSHSGGGGGGRSTSQAPRILSLSASSGSVGDTISLRGIRFSKVTAVSFKGTAIPFTIDSDSQISVEIPGGVGDGVFELASPQGSDTSASFDVLNRVWFVDASATGGHDGSSWNDAFVDLQAALGSAASGDEIWLVAGTYRPTSGSDTSASFQLLSGVGVYGGFGGDELLRSQRDYDTLSTVLSGDLSQNDLYTDSSTGDLSDNSLHVVTGTDGAILDGVTIQGGYAAAGRGGGLVLGTTAPTLRHLRVINNYADIGGGALDVGSVSLSISDSSFSDNKSLNENAIGGAIFANATSLTLNQVSFSDNWADISNSGGTGGAIYLSDGSLSLSSCTFSSNQAAYHSINGYGGAIALNSSSATISDSTFTGNVATQSGTTGLGGAIYALSSTVSILNSTFDQNQTAPGGSGARGGAIYALNGSLSITGSSFSNNEASIGGGASLGGAIFADTVNLSLSNDDFSGNLSGNGNGKGGAIYLANQDDLSWSDLSFSNNATSLNGGRAGFGGAIYILNSDRLTISDSSFSGNYASSTKSGQGGAIYAKADGLSLERVEFSANHGCATNTCLGGALYNEGADLSVKEVIVTDNYAAGTTTGSGGAFYLIGSGTTISDSVFAGNKACTTQAGCSGGAIYTSGDDFTLVNSVFVSNQAAPSSTGTGGALYFATAPTSASLSHLSFLNNRGPDLGPAIYCPGDLSLSDSIVWDESVSNPLAVTGSLTLNRSIVKDLASLTVSGSGNLDSDPLFTDAGTPAGADGIWLSDDDGLNLQSGSPAIGRAAGSATTSDILGNTRDASPDAGAYERLTP